MPIVLGLWLSVRSLVWRVSVADSIIAPAGTLPAEMTSLKRIRPCASGVPAVAPLRSPSTQAVGSLPLFWAVSLASMNVSTLPV